VVLKDIFAIRAKMNLGLSERLKEDFSGIFSVEKAKAKDIARRKPSWISG